MTTNARRQSRHSRFAQYSSRGLTVFFSALAFFVFSLPASILAASASVETQQRPNIVFILADDLGQYCLGCYGGSQYQTPNIDQLAESGMRFTHCHSRAMCAPTRRVLLSGCSFSKKLPEGTLPRVMQQQGYAVGFVGKWMQEDMPWNHGFEEGLVHVNWYKFWGPSFVAFNSGGMFKRYNLPQPLPTDMRDHQLPFDGPDAKCFKLRDEYGPRVLNQFALDYIERHRDQPFFLYYPMKLPHWPIMPTPDTPMGDRERAVVEAMKNWGVDDGDAHAIGASREWEADVVAYLDKLVGNVAAKLDELGLRDDTLLVFSSDNGPGAEGTVRKGTVRLPGRKGGVLEGATRAPCVLNWPGTIAARSTYDGLVDFTDLLPTFVEVAGGQLPKGDYDGVSFYPQLLGQPGNPRQSIYFHDGWHPGPASKELRDGVSGDWWDKSENSARVNYPLTDFGAFRYVLGTRYKLYSDGRFYDLEADLHERSPIAPGTGGDQAEAARQELRAVLDRYPAKPGEAKYRYRYE